LIRAVLDTNAHVSAALMPHGSSAKIILAWHQGKFTLIACPFILQEIGEVLRRSHIKNKYKGITEEAIEALISYIGEFAIITPGKVSVQAVTTDHKDDHILACAIEGEADYIVTGDLHLQRLKEYNGVSIVSLVEFIKFL